VLLTHTDPTEVPLSSDLAAEMARTSGRLRLRVSGTSMVPAVHPGDFLLVERKRVGELSKGEIAVFAREGRLIAHRVVDTIGSRHERHLLTRGDRARRNDVLVSRFELLGRVTSIERGCIRPGLQVNIAQRVISRLLRLSDRATSLYLRFAALQRGLFE
jgi:signal peptidase